MRYLIILVLGLNFPSALSGQNVLTGIVVDAATGAPLSFVNVFLKSDQSYGVLTNERGEYHLSLSEAQLNDRLVFSLLSYQTHEESLRQLDSAQTVLNLQMHTSFVELAEITVISDLGLRALVRRVIDRIPRNYGAEKYLLRGYVRKFSIDDGAYSQVVEAMVSIRDRAYAAPDQKWPKAWVDQFRKSDYQANAREDMRMYNNGQHTLLGGYLSPLDNPARVHSIHWLSQADETLSGMTFANRGEYVSNGDTLVKIQYGLAPDKFDISDAQRKAYENYFSGEILVNKTDYAMLRNVQGKIDEGWYRDIIYQKVDGKYYPKKISAQVSFEYNGRTQTSYRDNLLYVTEVITNRKAIKQVKTGKLLDYDGKIHALKADYDPVFWRKNEVLQLLPAPDALTTGMERLKRLEDQFRGNARRIRE